eukprot:1155945-Pelagomonas_calceolata.AAC.3
MAQHSTGCLVARPPLVKHLHRQASYFKASACVISAWVCLRPHFQTRRMKVAEKAAPEEGKSVEGKAHFMMQSVMMQPATMQSEDDGTQLRAQGWSLRVMIDSDARKDGV